MAYQDQMSQDELEAAFDEWAQTYDQDIGTGGDRFPFAGYPQALETVWEKAQAEPGMSVLDLGVGTGNLARPFVEMGCRVLGADFSVEMLKKTQKKLPQLELVQADLTLDQWPAALDRHFDRIVSNYVFHEFRLETKLKILARLARNHLAPGGRIVIGDIMFPTRADLNRVRIEHTSDWEEEFYWATDEVRALFEPAGWEIEYLSVSFCAGVYVLTPPAYAA